MAGEEASVSIAIDLESNAAAVAKGDAEALRELRESISTSTAELGGMNKALRALKGSGNESADTVAKLKAQIAATKATLASNTAAFVKAGGSFRAVPKDVAPAKKAVAELSTNFAKIESVNNTTSAMALLAPALSAVAVGATAVATALLAVTAAAAAGLVTLARYALEVANVRRNEELRLQGLSKYRNFWAEMVTGTARAADSSGFLQKQLDDVASSSALGRDRIAEMQAELYRAGLRSGNLQAALEGLAIAESTQGAEGAAQFKARALGAAMYGQSVKKVSDDIKARLGGIAKAQLLSLDVQSRKLRENIALLFKDLKIEGLLKAVSKVTELFSQSTASGRALKALLEGILSPLGSAAEKNGILVRRFFQGMIIGALEVGIALQRVRIWLKQTFGGSDLLKNINAQELAVKAGTIAFIGLAGAVATGVAIMGVLAAVVGAVIVGVVSLAAAIGYAAAAFVDNLVSGVRGAIKLLGAIDWLAVGKAIPLGIADGIVKGATWVIDAISNLADIAVKAFKNKLQIHSPSKLAAQLSLNVPRGIAVGFQAGTPIVHRAAANLADATEQGMRAGYDRMGGMADAKAPEAAPLGGGRGGSRSSSLTIADGAIRIDGAGKNADAIAREVLAKVEEMFVSTAREFAAGDA